MDGSLIGRSRERALLGDAVRAAAAGQRAIVMLTGEAGIGKTRLLDELAAQMAAAGGRAAWGRTWEVGLTPTYWPWGQVLAALAAPDDPAPALVGLDDRSDAASRLARFDAVGGFLIRRAAAQPLAILLDDVHAADPSSLLLLEYLARHVRAARLVIAMTARDGEAAAEVELALARIRRDARPIVVGRLDAGGVAALVGDRAPPALLPRVHELSDGNPLFVEELVACIAAHGGLDGVVRLTGVRAVIRDRIARLPADTARVLAVGALLGRELRGVVLADLLELAAAELDRRLAPALRLGVVTRPAADRYRFSHALVAEALADELAAGEAAQLHLRAAVAIARHDGDDGISAIAHHRLAASHLDPEAAVAAAERAAAAAMAHLAFEDAAALLERAIAVLAGVAGDTRKRRGAALCARAEALQHAGDHDAARALCAEAAALARDTGDGVLLARIALARGVEFRFGATDRVLVDLLREALAAMPPGDSSLRARCLARLAAAEQPATDPQRPIADAFAAIAMARRIGDRRTRLEVIHVAFAALIDYVPPRPLDELLRELFVLADRPGDRLIAVRNRLRHCFVTLELGDRLAYDAAVAAHAELTEAVGSARWRWPVELVQAMTALFEGRFDDAAAAADRAEAIAAAAADGQGELTLLYHRWIAARTRTAPHGALAREIAERYEYARPSLLLHAAFDDRDRDALPGRFAAADACIAADDVIAAMIAEVTAGAGDAAGAERLAAQLAPAAGRVQVASMTGFALQEIVDRTLLILATARGAWDEIDRHGQAAADAAARLGAAPWLARIRADWATALDLRRGDGDAARADALWHAARGDAERLGMPGLQARCQAARPDGEAIAPATAAPAAAAEPDDHAVSIVREGELWVARGRGCVARVRDSRGIQMLARLVAEPGRELHALELVGDGGAVDTGDAGEALDARAKAAYRTRLAELTQELDEAEAWADPVRATRARAEIDALTAELSRAVGLGGRDRKIASASERARSNAQRRLSHAIGQLRAAAPALGEHLQAATRTGTFCVYAPERRR